MNKIILALLIGFTACTTTKQKGDFYMPAEWEPQESVWFGWSTDPGIQSLHLLMIKAIHPQVGITLLSRSDSLQQAAFSSLSAAGVDTTYIEGYVHPIPNVFIRDAGPRFLKNSQGQLSIADFGWSNYGYPKEFRVYQDSDKRGEIDNALARELGITTVTSQMIAEGGGLDVSTDAILCFKETALQRNPGKSLEEIGQEYLRVYGKRKMIWLNRMPLMDKLVAGAKVGNYFGYGANGHVDEFARFVNDSTILVSTIDPAEAAQDSLSSIDHKIMQENLEILQAARDSKGRPYHIIELPTPFYTLYATKEVLTEAMREEGDGKVLYKYFNAGDTIRWLPAVSYANFFITNGKVLLAQYWQEGMPEAEKQKDAKALAILQQAFPDREIVQINPMALNVHGGGMHCSTQQQPVRK